MDELGHLSDERLNEYLDGVLSSRALSQADEHLRDCETCTRRLDEIAELFVTLDGLPEIHLRKDLAPQIVETLRSRSTVPSASTWKSTWRLGLALAGEAAGAPSSAQALVTTTVPTFAPRSTASCALAASSSLYVPSTDSMRCPVAIQCVMSSCARRRASGGTTGR